MSLPHPRHPLRTFTAGLLALLPLAATAALLAWTLQLLADWIGPGSAFGRLLTRVGLGVTESVWAGYAVGVLVLAGGVFAMGLLVQAGLERGFHRLVELLVQRIPVVRTIYDVVAKLVGLLGGRGEDELRTMTPVWLHFGGPAPAGEAATTTVVLGLLSTPQPVLIGGQPFHGVIVPTAPVPVGGGLLYVPADWVQPADLGMEAVTSIYVSMGVTSAQYLPTLKK